MTRNTEMNHVNLIGKMSSAPRIVTLSNGRKIARFSLTTKESFLDENGDTKTENNWHQVTAWGKWVPVLEKLGIQGQVLAIEGKIKSRFFRANGNTRAITEIVVNDLTIL